LVTEWGGQPFIEERTQGEESAERGKILATDPVMQLLSDEEERAEVSLIPEQRAAILKILRELVDRDVRSTIHSFLFPPQILSANWPLSRPEDAISYGLVFPLAHHYRAMLALGFTGRKSMRWFLPIKISMRNYWENLTSQEILSYHASHEKSCLRKEVRFGVKNRGKGSQLPILDRQS
jgi:hypothetical protein